MGGWALWLPRWSRGNSMCATDSDEYSAIESPGRGGPGMEVKTQIRLGQRFPENCRSIKYRTNVAHLRLRYHPPMLAKPFFLRVVLEKADEKKAADHEAQLSHWPRYNVHLAHR
jgi:hypothetical protein